MFSCSRRLGRPRGEKQNQQKRPGENDCGERLMGVFDSLVSPCAVIGNTRRGTFGGLIYAVVFSPRAADCQQVNPESGVEFLLQRQSPFAMQLNSSKLRGFTRVTSASLLSAREIAAPDTLSDNS